MQLILSLLKRTMIELRDIYTKLELDGLLDEKEDSTSMGLIDTESSEREAADNELDDRIEANKANDEAMANVVKWGVYASAMQKMVDEEMAELIRQEFEKAKEEYLADPTATKEWVTTKNENGTITSTCPYYSVVPTQPVIDFSVISSQGANSAYGTGFHAYLFNKNINQPIFLPNAIDCSFMLYRCSLLKNPVILPNAIYCRSLIQESTFNQPLSLPNAQVFRYGLYLSRSMNNPVYLPSVTDADGAFRGSGLDAANISKTLDSIPTHTDGASHIITFTGCPGASELTQESPSVAAAVAKGWTVEL